MKSTILNTAMLVTLFAMTTACSNSENQSTTTEESFKADTSLVGQDEQVLADDSATVQTAVGVKDEEANAKMKLQEDAQKLKQDEKK